MEIKLSEASATCHQRALFNKIKTTDFPGSPVVKISPSSAAGMGSTPDQEAKIPYVLWPKNKNIKQKQYCNKFNKDFKNGPHQKRSFKKIKTK